MTRRDGFRWDSEDGRPSQPDPEVRVSDRLPVRVILSVEGDVLATFDPNPTIGFRREPRSC